MASNSYQSTSYDSYEEVSVFQKVETAQPETNQKTMNKRSSNSLIAGFALVATTVAIIFMVTYSRGSLSSLQTYMAETSAVLSDTLTGTNKAKVVGTSRTAHGAFPELPVATDSESLHAWIKGNYLLYSSWIIAAGAMTAPIPTDLPFREPESSMGSRERDYAPIKESGYVIFGSFADPDCKTYYGYIAIQLNKCVASWMGSDAVTGPQTWYTVHTTVSESMITTTTQVFSDAECLVAATPSVNMTNNMACNAWGSHDKVFSKFSFAKEVPEVGAGAAFQGFSDASCSTGVQESLYIDVADGTECSGGLKAICDGTTKATLVHYIDVDYECNNHAVAEGYPMTMTPSCAWDNSYGLSAYGKATCGSPSEGYMAVPHVAPQLGGAYVIPDLEIWKPEEASTAESMEGPAAGAAPEVEKEAPAAPEKEAPASSSSSASSSSKQDATSEVVGGPMAQKNGAPPGSIKTAAAARKHSK